MSTIHSKSRSAPEQEARSAASEGIRHWLLTSAEALRARDALVLVRQGSRGFVFASHPQSSLPDDELSSVAHDAISDGLKLKRSTDAQGKRMVVVGLRSRIGGRPAAIVFRMDDADECSDDALISRVRLAALRRDDDDTRTYQTLPMGSVTPLLNPTLEPTQENVDRSVRHIPAAALAQPDNGLAAKIQKQGAAIETLAGVLDQPTADQAARALADALAKEFSCRRVTVGRTGRRFVIQAVSGTASIDDTSNQVLDVTLALDETVHEATLIAAPQLEKSHSIPPNHRGYLQSSGCDAIASVPLVESDSVIGAVMLERDQAFTQDDAEHLTHLVLLAAPVLALKNDADLGSIVRAGRSIRKGCSFIFGAKRLGLKLTMLLLLAALFASTQYTRPFTIDADASIEASVQRAIVAGSKGFINQVEKRAGDVVYRGDVLARLDVEELQLELIKWKGERDKLSKEQRAVMAQRDRSKIRILSARYAQAQAQVDFLLEQIERSVMRSPIDGVVVSGDLSEALGSPVERGQLLFEVASLEDYRLVLMVDEKDIGVVSDNLQGKLRLKSQPSTVFDFTVTRITPVALAGQGANQFRLEAEFTDLSPDVRPGMEGVAKIGSGERSLAWIWTRSFAQWARLQLWKWGGV